MILNFDVDRWTVANVEDHGLYFVTLQPTYNLFISHHGDVSVVTAHNFTPWSSVTVETRVL